MISLLYVSHSCIEDAAEQSVQKIVNASISRNSACDITGALVFTGIKFVQFLEGPTQAVFDLMEAVHRDVRHKDVRIFLQHDTSVRRFEHWSMAYGGRSGFVGRHIAALQSASSESERANVLEKVIGLMQSFAR